MEEVGLPMEGWVAWVEETCRVLIDSLAEQGTIVFYQTDRKYKGVLIDKKTLISKCFHQEDFVTVFSKIVLKQKPETINLFRPTFTNLFGFSREPGTGRATADVINAGAMMYKNAMGLNACRTAVEFIQNKTGANTIVDPFCGQGSVLAIANDMGLGAIGVDIDAEQVAKAKKLYI